MNSSVWMARALALARTRSGLTAPNPAVGAVLVKNGRVIGEGAHWGPGHPHAEAVALDDAVARGESPRGAELYVTLEPCCHEGGGKRTPPCAQRLVAEGVSEVYAAVPDPNPRVSGRGMALLKAAGVNVHWGPGEVVASELIADFSVWVKARRPFITLKWAQTLDGHTKGTLGGRWITGTLARAQGHSMRANHDAVAVGAGTLRVDDPDLRVREAPLGPRGQPRRLIFAGKKALPATARVFTDGYRDLTWVVANPQEPVWDQANRWTDGRVLPWDGQDPVALGEVLLGSGFYRVFVEGGATLLSFFQNHSLWDRVAVFLAPSFRDPTGEQTRFTLGQPQWGSFGDAGLVEGWNPASPSLGATLAKEVPCLPA